MCTSLARNNKKQELSTANFLTLFPPLVFIFFLSSQWQYQLRCQLTIMVKWGVCLPRSIVTSDVKMKSSHEQTYKKTGLLSDISLFWLVTEHVRCSRSVLQMAVKPRRCVQYAVFANLLALKSLSRCVHRVPRRIQSGHSENGKK